MYISYISFAMSVIISGSFFIAYLTLWWKATEFSDTVRKEENYLGEVPAYDTCGTYDFYSTEVGSFDGGIDE